MKNGSTASQNLIDLIAKIGEKITIGRLKTLENSKSKIFTYNHSIVKDNLSKLGVIVSLEFEKSSKEIEQFGKQISFCKMFREFYKTKKLNGSILKN